MAALFANVVRGQDSQQPATEQANQSEEEPTISEVPEAVEVAPVATDSMIEDRLQSILAATEWFQNSEVSVNEGIVTLR